LRLVGGACAPRHRDAPLPHDHRAPVGNSELQTHPCLASAFWPGDRVDRRGHSDGPYPDRIGARSALHLVLTTCGAPVASLRLVLPKPVKAELDRSVPTETKLGGSAGERHVLLVRREPLG